MFNIQRLDDKVQALYRFECHGCRRSHEELCHPNDFERHSNSWSYKHSLPTCEITYYKLWHRVPRDFSESNWLKRSIARFGQAAWEFALPWYLQTWEYKPNANFQLAFNSSTNLTYTSLSGLNSSTGLTAGASSQVVDNGTSATLLDLTIGGYIKMGGSAPTAGQAIYTYAWTLINDTTYPDGITGSDALITVSSANAANGFLRSVAGWTLDATANLTYPTAGNSLLDIFGGAVQKWGLWTVQNGGTALAPSGHQFSIKQNYVVG